jgi:hypothetical protein
MVCIEHTALICKQKNFLRTENFRRPNRRMQTAFDFEREFGRSADFSLSGTIAINRSIFRDSASNATLPTWPKTTVSVARAP